MGDRSSQVLRGPWRQFAAEILGDTRIKPLFAAGPARKPALSPAAKTFEQQRLAQDQAAASTAPRPSAPENPRAQPWSPALEQRAAAAARASGEAPPPATDDPQQPPQATEGEKHKIGKYEVSESELGAMMERQAVDDLRKATVPPTPQDYKLALPENLKLPGGQEFKFDEAGAKATFDAVKGWAHAKGMSQADLSEMLGLYASHQAGVDAALAERSQQEIAKVGINASMRVDAIGKWITGTVGEKDAAAIRAALTRMSGFMKRSCTRSPRRAAPASRVRTVCRQMPTRSGLRQHEFRTTAPGVGRVARPRHRTLNEKG